MRRWQPLFGAVEDAGSGAADRERAAGGDLGRPAVGVADRGTVSGPVERSTDGQRAGAVEGAGSIGVVGGDSDRAPAPELLARPHSARRRSPETAPVPAKFAPLASVWVAAGEVDHSARRLREGGTAAIRATAREGHRPGAGARRPVIVHRHCDRGRPGAGALGQRAAGGNGEQVPRAVVAEAVGEGSVALRVEGAARADLDRFASVVDVGGAAPVGGPVDAEDVAIVGAVEDAGSGAADRERAVGGIIVVPPPLSPIAIRLRSS